MEKTGVSVEMFGINDVLPDKEMRFAVMCSSVK